MSSLSDNTKDCDEQRRAAPVMVPAGFERIPATPPVFDDKEKRFWVVWPINDRQHARSDGATVYASGSANDTADEGAVAGWVRQYTSVGCLGDVVVIDTHSSRIWRAPYGRAMDFVALVNGEGR